MINCYPVAGKQKSIDVCRAFARGCDGAVIYDGKWRPGASFFFGVNDSNQGAYEGALLNAQFDWYYGDNAYFDCARGTHFRVTKNRHQHSGIGQSAGRRFLDKLPGLNVWREDEGKHIVICPQSDDFMRRIVGYTGNWVEDVRAQLALWTSKKIIVRGWNRNKAEAAATLHDDLREAHACIVWSSAAGNESVWAGVPTVVMGQSPARLFSVPLQSLALATIPHPAGNRVEWASVLCDNQWTLDELSKGTAWRSLNREQA